VAAGRGSGKTELAKRFLVRALQERKPYPDPRYFYGGPTYQQAKRVAWNHLLRLIPKSWIRDQSTSELVITTIWGSELHVVGLDKPQRIEGVQWDGCIIDEACDVTPAAFRLSVLPALAWRDGWCWRIGVPKRFGVGAAEFRDAFERGLRGEDEGSESFTWPSSDILPPAAMAQARRIMDPKDFAEQFGAQWLTASGGVFYAFSEEFNVRPVVYDPTAPILVGSDFNVDPMAWVLGQQREGRLEIFDELWLRDANTPATLNALWSRYQDHAGGWQFFGDATGRARKSSAVTSDYGHISNDPRFLKAGRSLHYFRANPLTADRFAAANALILNGAGERRLYVAPHCKHLIQDLRLRSYKAGSREAADTGDVGHISDACSYIIHKLYPIRMRIDEIANQTITTTR